MLQVCQILSAYRAQLSYKSNSFHFSKAGRRSGCVFTKRAGRRTTETLYADNVTVICGIRATQLSQQDVCSCAVYNRYVLFRLFYEHLTYLSKKYKNYT